MHVGSQAAHTHIKYRNKCCAISRLTSYNARPSAQHGHDANAVCSLSVNTLQQELNMDRQGPQVDSLMPFQSRKHSHLKFTPKIIFHPALSGFAAFVSFTINIHKCVALNVVWRCMHIQMYIHTRTTKAIKQKHHYVTLKI